MTRNETTVRQRSPFVPKLARQTTQNVVLLPLIARRLGSSAQNHSKAPTSLCPQFPPSTRKLLRIKS